MLSVRTAKLSFGHVANVVTSQTRSKFARNKSLTISKTSTKCTTV